MHTGDAIPRVAPATPMIEVIYEMSRKGLGVTAVTEGDKLIGILSDGDLRRLLEQRGKDALELTAAQCMTVNPRTIAPTAFAAQALDLMEQRKITSLMVVSDGNTLEGVVHLHDLWGVELV
jgi:arabinose-5-phosphate isomerase